MLGVSQENLEKKRESQAEISTTSPEDEALKRNTDCVYFLASPLTCKKGSECEYRHSEVARVNPRDCYYWLNGNCMNPKCAFRHPPLDGLLGTRVTTPLGHSLPLMQSVPTPSAQALHVPGKQAVPCIFFQQGYCLKGDLCPFMHAPYSSSDKVAQLAVATPVTEFQSYKKTFGGLQKSTQQKNSQKNVRIPVEVPVQGKSVLTDRAPLRNGFTINETLAVHAGLDDELSKYKPENVHSASSGKSVRSNNSQQVDVLDNQNILSGKDADEFSREHSPGFDVLVDGELGESDYYHNEDQFGGTRIHDERILNAPNDYEVDRMSSYHSMADGDRDMYNDPHGYDSYDHYGRKEQRVSSERMLGGSAHLERRQRPIADNTGRTDESDLRHHLLKQKRGDNSRSVVSRTHSSKNRFDDRIYRPPQRDHMRACESVISSRLRGRIKIPGRSTSPDNRTGSWSERKTDRGRHRGRLSPELLQGRLKERMKGRVQDDHIDEDRISRNSRMSHEFRNNVYENGDWFTGPKSLSELKVGKGERTELHVSDRQLLGKRKYPKLDGAPQQGEGDISFEGPKPLSEILKRKRGVASADYEKGSTSRNNYDNYRKEANENVIISTDTKKTKDVFSSQPVGEASFVQRNEEPKSAAADINVAGEKVKLNLNQSSLQPETEGMIGDEVMEDHEPEAYEQAEGFSDYEQADGEDYNLEEGENLEPEDEYYEEEEDADDFAKKMGVTY